MKRFIVVLVVLGVLLSACGAPIASAPQPSASSSRQQVAVPGGAYTNVSVTDLQQMLRNKDFTLVNVHIPFEGNIAGTDRSIPYDQIAQQGEQLPSDKNAKLVLYCRTGSMSDIAARTLVQQGYTNVWNLDGGMVAWEQAGFTLQR